MPTSNPAPDATAWRAVLDTHLANLRSHRAVLDHVLSLYGGNGGAAAAELEAMRARAERIWEDAVRAGEVLGGGGGGGEREGGRGETPAETPSKRRRISSGVEVEVGEGEEEEEEDEGDEDGEGGGERRVVVANVPLSSSVGEAGLRRVLKGYELVKFKHPVRLPTRSEIHVYDLPAYAHANGFVKAELASTRAAARAVRELDGSRLDERSQGALIVRRYRDPVSPNRVTVRKRQRTSSGQHAQRENKRMKIEDDAPAPVDAPNRPRVPAPFVFTAGSAGPAEQQPEFEDISAEVEARLAEQAARRAAAKQKGNGSAGRKRKRSSGASAGDLEAEASVEEGIKGMMLVDRRPKKKARESMADEDAGVEERAEPERQPQPSGFAKSKAKMRKERRRGRRREEGSDGRIVEESPRPVKRSRVSGGDEVI